MQSYENRLKQLATLVGYDFNVKRRGMRVFGHHEGEYQQTDALVTKLLHELRLKVRVLVELGVNWGASLFMLARFVQDRARIIGVDVGEYHGIYDVHEILGPLRNENHKVTFLHCLTKMAVEHVRLYAPIDLLHIDADHSYESSRFDWDTYTPMVRKNGIILLHDIRWCDGVQRLFEEEKKRTVERFHEIVDGDRGMAVVVKTW